MGRQRVERGIQGVHLIRIRKLITQVLVGVQKLLIIILEILLKILNYFYYIIIVIVIVIVIVILILILILILMVLN